MRRLKSRKRLRSKKRSRLRTRLRSRRRSRFKLRRRARSRTLSKQLGRIPLGKENEYSNKFRYKFRFYILKYYLHNAFSICRYSGRESYKDVNSLHLPNERFSPVRRASDGMTSINKYQCHHLEKLYHQTLSQPSSRNSSLRALQAEHCQLQRVAGNMDAEKQATLQQQHAMHRLQQLVGHPWAWLASIPPCL